MKYKLTILNVTTGLYLSGILITSILKYKVLSREEGWGIVAMAGLAFIGVLAGLVDLILQYYVKNALIHAIIDILIVIIVAFFILIA
jgi:hypothetical protein